MSQKIASLISILLHPLLMPTLVFFIVFHYAPIAIALPNPAIKGTLLLSVFISTFVLPLASLLAFRLTSFAAMQMSDRRQRVAPFTFVALLYGIVAYFFAVKLNLNPAINVIFIATAALVVLAAVITVFWQISMHSIGVSGAAGFILGFFIKYPDNQLLAPLTALILCVGLAASSRLLLNRHDPAEVWGGVALGFTGAFGSVMVFL